MCVGQCTTIIKMPLSFVLSQKRKKNLVHDNYIYREYYRSKNAVHWRCVLFEEKKCQAKIRTTSDHKCGKIIDTGNCTITHNHVSEKSDISVVKVKNKFKKMASTTAESSMNIVSKCTNDISSSTSSSLPLNKSMCKTIQRQRTKILGGPALPTDVNNFVVPDMFKKTLRGELFLLFDSNENGKRILIYTTMNNLKILKKCKVWQGDGTFDTVPNIFEQLYTIHGRYRGNLIPLVYVITTHRDKETYKKVLEQLSETMPGLKPSKLIVDFDLAFIYAFEEFFAECDIHGCYFHWTQCIWRKIQNLHMQQKYQNDEDFSFQIKKLLALAFVKPEDVIKFYEELIESEYYVTNEDYLKPLLNYFETTWIRKKNRRGRCKAPIFPIELWNCFDSIIEDSPRTNNAVEGWHNGFSNKLNCSHTSLWKFLNSIQNEQNLNENKITDIIAKKVFPVVCKKYIELNKRLFKIVYDYDSTDNDVETYLQSLALNLRL